MADTLKSVPGMSDLLPADARVWQFIEDTARAHFKVYGFAEIRVPIMEDTKLFSRGIGEGTQVVQKEMYTFIDRGGDSVTLRPEGTAGVVRAYIQHSLQAHDPINKLFYFGPMFRYERPQKGRLRQFHQIGAETFGTDSSAADAEMIIMLDRFIRKLGIRGYHLQINSLGTLAERVPFLAKLTADLESRKEKLCAECQNRLEKNPLRVFDCKNPQCRIELASAPSILDALAPETKAHFDAVCASLNHAGVEFVINPRIVRGLDYYEKTAFEFTSSQLGSQSAFAGGGRYNQLVQELGGAPTPAVGFAIGCERLVMLLQESPILASIVQPPRAGVYIAPMDEKALSAARTHLQTLRDHGLRAEMDYEAKSFKSSMRRADKHHFRFVILIGENELSNGTLTIKDLDKGSQTNISQLQLIEHFQQSAKTDL
jgi:histidyl-tRNA synthetase